MKAQAALLCVVALGPIGVRAQDPFPAGSISFFDRPDCPEGWQRYEPANGRMIVPVNPEDGLGDTVGAPLPPGGRIEHTHSWSAGFDPDSVSYIAAVGGGNRSLAADGPVTARGTATQAVGSLPLMVCKKTAEPSSGNVPRGATAFFESDPCPVGWELTPGPNRGHFLRPADFERNPPEPTPDFVPALSPRENRMHNHEAVPQQTFRPEAHSVALATGCCGGGYAAATAGLLTPAMDPAAWNIPYIQLLQCVKRDDQGPPTITAVTNGASFQPRALAPGEIVTLFGSGFGPLEGEGTSFDENGELLREIAGVVVRVGRIRNLIADAVPAPLFFVREDQINFQVPYEVTALGTFVSMQVVRDGVEGNSVDFSLATASPGVFQFADGSDLAVVVQPGRPINSETDRARPGDTVVLFATGEGLTVPASQTGVPAPMQPPFPRPILPVTVEIGGIRARLEFNGAAPGFVGLMQLNVVIPDGAPSGLVPLVLRIGLAEAELVFIWIA